MSLSQPTMTLPPGTDILIVYPVRGGTTARFIPGVVKTPRHFDESDRLYGPASFLEGITLPSALAGSPDFTSLGNAQFERALMAVVVDALDGDAAERLTVLRERHHLVIVDSHVLDAA